ncbi:hypothetical protein KIN20_025696, partial [Parelaphostrongylus tenuis]
RPSAKNGTTAPPPKKSVELSLTRSSTSSVEVPQQQFVKINPQKGSGDTTDIARVTAQKPRSMDNSTEDKVKDLLMKAKVEQQRLAKQLAQSPSVYTSTPKCVAAAPPSSSSHARLETSTTNVSFYAPVKVENEAEKVVPSTTASVDTPRNIALRPLAPRPSAPRPSCSQNSHDFVVGQTTSDHIFPKLEHKKAEETPSASSTSTTMSLSSTSTMSMLPPSSSALNSSTSQRSQNFLLLFVKEIPLKERLSEFNRRFPAKFVV